MYGRRAGFAVGTGAAAADTFWGAVGAYSLVFVVEFLERHSIAMRFFGGIVLILVGVLLIIKPAQSKEPDALKKIDQNVVKDFVTAFFLTVSNPGTIFAFLAVFAGFEIHTNGDFHKAVPLISGVLCGSLFWWYTLTFCVSMFRITINDKNIHRMNVLTGILISGFGAAALLSVLQIF